jgi:hypothetical protein
MAGPLRGSGTAAEARGPCPFGDAPYGGAAFPPPFPPLLPLPPPRGVVGVLARIRRSGASARRRRCGRPLAFLGTSSIDSSPYGDEDSDASGTPNRTCDPDSGGVTGGPVGTPVKVSTSSVSSSERG